MVTLL